MNEELNVNGLMDAVIYQVSRMDLPSQLSWYLAQSDLMMEDASDVGYRLATEIEEAIEEQTGDDDVEIDMDLDEGLVSFSFDGTILGETSDSIQSMVDRYKAVKVVLNKMASAGEVAS